jgi:hypothetical protein
LIAEAEDEMRALLKSADERAAALLNERRDALDQLADILLERETLEGAELQALLADAGVTAAAGGNGSRAARARKHPSTAAHPES